MKNAYFCKMTHSFYYIFDNNRHFQVQSRMLANEESIGD